MKVKAISGEPIVYQPYLGHEQRREIKSGATALDISFNTSPDTREYELFQALHAHHRAIGLKPEAFWGVISRKFEAKSCSPFSEFLAQAKIASDAGFDCYAHNPMIGNAAIFASVWEQGNRYHAGMHEIFSFLGRSGIDVQGPQDTTTFFFCNYVCGNDRFWSAYFTFCEHVLDMLKSEAQRNSTIGKILDGNVGYWRDGTAGMRPFVIERLLGTFLKMTRESGLKVACYDPPHAVFERKFGNVLGGALHHLHVKKSDALKRGDAASYTSWHKARMMFVEHPAIVITCDDPPEWWSQRG